MTIIQPHFFCNYKLVIAPEVIFKIFFFGNEKFKNQTTYVQITVSLINILGSKILKKQIHQQQCAQSVTE